MKLSLALALNLALLTSAAPALRSKRAEPDTDGQEVSPEDTDDFTSKIAYGSLKSAAQMMDIYDDDKENDKNTPDYGNNMPISMTPNEMTSFPNADGSGPEEPTPIVEEEDEEEEISSPTPSSSKAVTATPSATPSSNADVNVSVPGAPGKDNKDDDEDKDEDEDKEEKGDGELKEEKKKPASADPSPSASPSPTPKPKPDNPLANLPVIGGLAGGLLGGL